MTTPMKAEWLNPFFIAFSNMVREIVPEETTFEVGAFYIADEMRSSFDVAVVSTISGDAVGKVVLSMESNAALGVAETMMNKAVDSFESEAQSAVQELMNMVAGNALSALVGEGVHVLFSPPTLFYSQYVSTITADCPIALTLPIHTGMGEMELNVALRVDDSNQMNVESLP